MPRRESKLEFNNPICWLLGHDVEGKVVVKSRRRVSGEMADSWQQYCKRCQNPDSFPNSQFPDRRNLYRRTIPVWILTLRNRWKFRNFDRDAKRDRKRHLFYLEERLKKYSPKEPKT